MRRALAVALLGAVLLLSGCLGFVGGAADETATPTPTATDTPTATPTETETSTPTASETTTPSTPQTPEVEKIVVNVNEFTSGESKDWVAMTREAADYWEGEGATHLEKPVQFEVEESPDDADLRVHFVTTLTECGEYEIEPQTIGCSERGVVRIQVCEGRSQMVATVKHELGHQLGLDHGDEPSPLMDAVSATGSCF